MPIENIKIGEVLELIRLFSGNQNETKTENNPLIGQVCVVRTYSAGVHIGEVIRQDKEQVDLKNSRRLWKWQGAFTLSEVATKGVSSESRIAVEIPFIRLTNAIEIIPCSKKALKTFEACNE